MSFDVPQVVEAAARAAYYDECPTRTLLDELDAAARHKRREREYWGFSE